MSRHAIILGAGQIGVACAEHLIASGWSVDLLARHRSSAAPAEAAQHAVDRRDASALSEAIGSGGDLLIDTVAFDRADAEQLVALADRFGAVAAISSAAVYCDAQARTIDSAEQTGFPAGMTDLAVGHPTVAPGGALYSTRKAAMEQRLLSGAPDKAVIIRPCAIHGPHSRHPREWWFVKRILDGRTRIPLGYDGQTRFQTGSIGAIARLIGALAESGASGIYNCADRDAPSVHQIGETIAAHLGVAVEFVPVETPVGTVGRTPWSVPNDFTLANTGGADFAHAYADEVAPALDWLLHLRPADWRAAFPTLSGYPWELFDYEAEDAALASL